ncbi:MAG: GPW/gp25 family protein [Candidatus Thiodiazotropha endolucinida]|nr:GPW/gp25 family protein [Candidatus Thiodiazotropha taylori]MCW4263395.1 GPW/gp25 family protein [Candidatus Thiodiazotropha endolucinida]
MNGMNRSTGQMLSGVDHLRQSIEDILTTPIGTRIMRREYGSRLYQLVDAPINRALFVEIYSATSEALLNWEPRFDLTRVRVENITVGNIQIGLEGVYIPDNKQLILEGVLI